MIDAIKRLESTEREVEKLRVELSQWEQAIHLERAIWRHSLEKAQAAARQVVREVLAREPDHPCAPDWLRTWPWLESIDAP